MKRVKPVIYIAIVLFIATAVLCIVLSVFFKTDNIWGEENAVCTPNWEKSAKTHRKRCKFPYVCNSQLSDDKKGSCVLAYSLGENASCRVSPILCSENFTCSKKENICKKKLKLGSSCTPENEELCETRTCSLINSLGNNNNNNNSINNNITNKIIENENNNLRFKKKHNIQNHFASAEKEYTKRRMLDKTSITRNSRKRNKCNHFECNIENENINERNLQEGKINMHNNNDYNVNNNNNMNTNINNISSNITNKKNKKIKSFSGYFCIEKNLTLEEKCDDLNFAFCDEKCNLKCSHGVCKKKMQKNYEHNDDNKNYQHNEKINAENNANNISSSIDTINNKILKNNKNDVEKIEKQKENNYEQKSIAVKNSLRILLDKNEKELSCKNLCCDNESSYCIENPKPRCELRKSLLMECIGENINECDYGLLCLAGKCIKKYSLQNNFYENRFNNFNKIYNYNNKDHDNFVVVKSSSNNVIYNNHIQKAEKKNRLFLNENLFIYINDLCVPWQQLVIDNKNEKKSKQKNQKINKNNENIHTYDVKNYDIEENIYKCVDVNNNLCVKDMDCWGKSSISRLGYCDVRNRKCVTPKFSNCLNEFHLFISYIEKIKHIYNDNHYFHPHNFNNYDNNNNKYYDNYHNMFHGNINNNNNKNNTSNNNNFYNSNLTYLNNNFLFSLPFYNYYLYNNNKKYKLISNTIKKLHNNFLCCLYNKENYEFDSFFDFKKIFGEKTLKAKHEEASKKNNLRTPEEKNEKKKGENKMNLFYLEDRYDDDGFVSCLPANDTFLHSLIASSSLTPPSSSAPIQVYKEKNLKNDLKQNDSASENLMQIFLDSTLNDNLGSHLDEYEKKNKEKFKKINENAVKDLLETTNNQNSVLFDSEIDEKKKIQPENKEKSSNTVLNEKNIFFSSPHQNVSSPFFLMFLDYPFSNIANNEEEMTNFENAFLEGLAASVNMPEDILYYENIFSTEKLKNNKTIVLFSIKDDETYVNEMIKNLKQQLDDTNHVSPIYAGKLGPYIANGAMIIEMSNDFDINKIFGEEISKTSGKAKNKNAANTKITFPKENEQENSYYKIAETQHVNQAEHNNENNNENTALNNISIENNNNNRSNLKENNKNFKENNSSNTKNNNNSLNNENNFNNDNNNNALSGSRNDFTTNNTNAVDPLKDVDSLFLQNMLNFATELSTNDVLKKKATLYIIPQLTNDEQIMQREIMDYIIMENAEQNGNNDKRNTLASNGYYYDRNAHVNNNNIDTNKNNNNLVNEYYRRRVLTAKARNNVAYTDSQRLAEKTKMTKRIVNKNSVRRKLQLLNLKTSLLREPLKTLLSNAAHITNVNINIRRIIGNIFAQYFNKKVRFFTIFATLLKFLPNGNMRLSFLLFFKAFVTNDMRKLVSNIKNNNEANNYLDNTNIYSNNDSNNFTFDDEKKMVKFGVADIFRKGDATFIHFEAPEEAFANLLKCLKSDSCLKSNSKTFQGLSANEIFLDTKGWLYELREEAVNFPIIDNHEYKKSYSNLSILINNNDGYTDNINPLSNNIIIEQSQKIVESLDMSIPDMTMEILGGEIGKNGNPTILYFKVYSDIITPQEIFEKVAQTIVDPESTLYKEEKDEKNLNKNHANFIYGDVTVRPGIYNSSSSQPNEEHNASINNSFYTSPILFKKRAFDRKTSEVLNELESLDVVGINPFNFDSEKFKGSKTNILDFQISQRDNEDFNRESNALEDNFTDIKLLVLLSDNLDNVDEIEKEVKEKLSTALQVNMSRLQILRFEWIRFGQQAFVYVRILPIGLSNGNSDSDKSLLPVSLSQEEIITPKSAESVDIASEEHDTENNRSKRTALESQKHNYDNHLTNIKKQQNIVSTIQYPLLDNEVGSGTLEVPYITIGESKEEVEAAINLLEDTLINALNVTHNRIEVIHIKQKKKKQ